MTRLVDAFSKLRARGRASMEEINRFVEAGVPLIASLADHFEVTNEEVFKLVETGKVGFADVNAALEALTTGEGQFAGLIEKQGDSGRGAYVLTDLGRSTDRVLWELSRFGGRLDRDPEPRPPGNLRTIALPLRILLESADDRPDLVALLRVDGEPFTVVSTPDSLDVVYGEIAPPADVEVRTTYDAVLDVSEGVITPAEFAAGHVEVVAGVDRLDALLALLGAAFEAAG